MASILERVRGHGNQPVIPSLPSPEGDDVFEEMTLQEHLEELRTRILYSAIFVVIGFGIGLAVAMPVLRLMARMSGLHDFVTISPMEGFTEFMKVGLYIGIGLSMPALVYQLVRFLAPGLTRRERHYLYRALPFVSILFLAGVAFAFFIVVPHALEFLSHFGGSVFTSQFRAQEVVSFYLKLLLGIGVVFETPLIIFMLAKLGVVGPQRLSSLRKYMIVISLVLAAVITPTPDPVNMFIVAAPIYLLYELGVILARFA
ncbi:MAG TPA: twin-arginine translocase subunit TatC [Thermomicrobiaceae bacterium]|nr:twin-arginine translocase subunit TatC [Thermomicrobiaceae bacterium]